MSRKHRKRLRRLKQQPIKKWLTNTEIKRLAKQAVKLWQPEPKETGKKFFCPSCQQSWEYGYDGIIVFCRDCFYLNGCDKEIKEIKTCKHCEV